MQIYIYIIYTHLYITYLVCVWVPTLSILFSPNKRHLSLLRSVGLLGRRNQAAEFSSRLSLIGPLRRKRKRKKKKEKKREKKIFFYGGGGARKKKGQKTKGFVIVGRDE